MSLLLLLGGASAPAGDDRTFTATWEQVAAVWSATATGPGTPESLSEFPMALERLEQLPAKFAGRWRQPPASWRAAVDHNDDEITLIELDAL